MKLFKKFNGLSIRILFRRYFKRTNKIRFFFLLNTLPYKIISLIIRSYFGSWQIVKCIFVRHGISEGDIVPGESDIDFGIIIKDAPLKEEKNFVMLFWKRYLSFKRIFPMLGEVEIYTEREFELWHFSPSIEPKRFNNVKYITNLEKRNNSKNEVPDRASVINETLMYFQFYSMFYFGAVTGKTFTKYILKTVKALICCKNNNLESISRSRQDMESLLRNIYPELGKTIAILKTKQWVNLDDFDVTFCLNFIENELSQAIQNSPSNLQEKEHLYRIIYKNERLTSKILYNKLKEFIEELKKAMPRTETHLLPGNLNAAGFVSDYSNKLYLVFDNEQNTFTDTLRLVSKIIQKYLPRWPYNYFGSFAHPIILSKSMFDYLINNLNPLDFIVLKTEISKEERTCYIKDGIILKQFSGALTYERSLFNKPFIVRNADRDRGSELALIDLVLDTLRKRLFLEKNIIALSVNDIVESYIKEFPKDNQIEWLKNFHRKYSGLGEESIDKIPRLKDLYNESYDFLYLQKKNILENIDNILLADKN